MIECPNCARSNAEHFKFCLGCGTDLKKASKAKPAVDVVRESGGFLEAPRRIRSSDGIPPLASIGEAPPMTGEVPVEDIAPAFRSRSRSDALRSGLVSSKPVPAAPSEPAKSPQKSSQTAAAVASEPQARICHSCGAKVPPSFRFCGVCGTRYELEAIKISTDRTAKMSVPRATMVLIHSDGTEGERFELSTDTTTVGRQHRLALFSEDPFLSPKHASFYFVGGQLHVRDEASLNGVFLRIRAEVELAHGDLFRLGQQLMRFEEMAKVKPIIPGAGDGTTVLGSPSGEAWGRVSSVVAVDVASYAWLLAEPEIRLGRDRGELCFPEDGFVSGVHCKLAHRRGRSYLADTGSTNGTYLRISGDGVLGHGDLLLLGQQLFKIELSVAG